MWPHDTNGNYVEPFIIDGSVYLPVRGIASAMDMEVNWNQNNNTVELVFHNSVAELLMSGNQSATSVFNFVDSFSSGSAFDVDWGSYNGPDPGWYRITESGINSLADVRSAWYRHLASTSTIPNAMMNKYKVMNGAVCAYTGGRGDSMIAIRLTDVVQSTRTTAVIKGYTYYDQDPSIILGDVLYNVVWENNAWRCEKFTIDGVMWGI